MPSSASRQDNILKADFLQNDGGINNTDSTFQVLDTQCVDGYNFDYSARGAIKKRQGLLRLALTSFASLGLGQHTTAAGVKTLLRAAGGLIRKVDSTTYAETNLTEDTASAGTSVRPSNATTPVVFSQFNSASPDDVTGEGNVAWMAGGSATSLYGVTSATKFTKNGASTPTGSISVADSGDSGSLANVPYYYGVALYKASTQVTSNVALDTTVTPAANRSVNVDLTGITSYDTTKYSQIWVYRSGASGSEGFTTGYIIAKIAYNGTTYTLEEGSGVLTGGVYKDDGSSITDVINIPRAGNILIDQSELPAGNPISVATYKRRLVTAINSTLYFSDLNKPESWPLTNFIDIPSGGPITGLVTLSYNTASLNQIDEILCVFKERELWVITGSNFVTLSNSSGSVYQFADIALKFISNDGCPAQTLITQANGVLGWINQRGVFLWDGAGKPLYASRNIEALFQDGSPLDKSKLTLGVSCYDSTRNYMMWVLSHTTLGEQKFAIKLDLKRTLPSVTQTLDTRMVDGVFIFDNWLSASDDDENSIYALASLIPPDSQKEVVFGAAGRDDAAIYQVYSGYRDEATGQNVGIDFKYKTKFLDMGSPGVTKRFTKVIAYVNRLGNYDLTLNYWANYRTADSNKSSRSELISSAEGQTTALWDVAVWDVAQWDDFTPELTTLVFNLSSENNNTEGDCLQLQFTQSGSDQPVTIYGFSVLYSELGIRK